MLQELSCVDSMSWFSRCWWCHFFLGLGRFWSLKHLLGCGCCWSNSKIFCSFSNCGDTERTFVFLIHRSDGFSRTPRPSRWVLPSFAMVPYRLEGKKKVTASHSLSSLVVFGRKRDELTPLSHFSAGPPGLQGFRGEAGLPGAKGKLLFPCAIRAALADVPFSALLWETHLIWA